MGIGVSVFLIAVGAILTFAIEVETQGVNLDTIGIILMIAGVVGLLVSMLVFGDRTPRDEGRTVVRERDVA